MQLTLLLLIIFFCLIKMLPGRSGGTRAQQQGQRTITRESFAEARPVLSVLTWSNNKLQCLDFAIFDSVSEPDSDDDLNLIRN